MDEQEVTVGVFDAGEELVGDVAAHAGDDGGGLLEGLLEGGLLVGTDGKGGYFEDHAS